VERQVVGGSTATSYDWLTDIGDLSLSVSDLDGGANLSNLTFGVQDNSHSLTADLASFVLEGKKVQLLEGFVGLALRLFGSIYRKDRLGFIKQRKYRVCLRLSGYPRRLGEGYLHVRR
jgi:hypothetical protein